MRTKEESDAVEEILGRLRFFVHHSPISEFAISRKMNVQSPSLSKWLAGGAVPNCLSLRKIRRFLEREAEKIKFDYRTSFSPSQLEDLRRCAFCRSRRIRLSRTETRTKRPQYFAICERLQGSRTAGSQRNQSAGAMEQERAWPGQRQKCK
jgi:hypothetical protein